ncbi:MAG: hypothetical protein SVT52_01950 [Planctomycetota bacterium]|nr:hypothetical protein [Planctomycetota bacterium]
MPPRAKSISQLRKELATKKKQLKKARTRRAKLTAQLAAVDHEITKLTGKAAPARRKKARKAAKKAKRVKKVRKARKAGRKKSAKRTKATRRKRTTRKPLLTHLKLVLGRAKGGLRVKDAAAAVVKSGYTTKSKDFYSIVATTLRDKDNFRRVGRGIYKLKG